MSYYDSFLYTPMKPINSWKTQVQELLNEEFTNASNVIMIEEEKEFGTLNFTPKICRVITTLDSKVIDKVNDDYRTLFFNDLEYQPKLGQRYRFLNNIWIVYNTDNHNSLNSGCYVRRCNNTINSLDFYGNLHEEPCVVDIKPTKSSFIQDESMWAPSTRQIIFFQKNKWTKDIGFNSRVMFEDQTYRVGVNLNFDRTSTFEENSVQFVRAYLDLDLVNEYDNKYLQIADYKKPNFVIGVPEQLNLLPNTTDILEYDLYLNGKPIEDKVVWYSDNPSVITISKFTGQYTTKELGEANITVCLAGNEEYKSEIKITVTSEIEEITETIITPQDYYIPLNQSRTYEVYEEVNGEQQDTSFDFEFYNLSKTYYSVSKTDNSFTITNKKTSDSILLEVNIINRRSGETSKIYIELGGLF